MNYFELFNIPVSFSPDPIALKKKYYELSRKYHPDFFTQENEADQAEALDISSVVNKAYKVFQNPDQTIKYILQWKGLLFEDEKYILPPNFLMEMMEMNEQLMDATMEKEEEQIAVIKKEIADKEEEIYLPVKAIIENQNAEEIDSVHLSKIKEYYFKKKYLNRILATIA